MEFGLNIFSPQSFIKGATLLYYMLVTFGLPIFSNLPPVPPLYSGIPYSYSKIFTLSASIRGTENSPDSLNVMVNYHYHGENRVITR